MTNLLAHIIRILRATIRPFFPQVLVNYLYHLPRAWIVSRIYGNPGRDLEIIGVTGTDGKTTTSLLIYHILKVAEKKVAVISTVEAGIGSKRIKTGFHVTAPSPWGLQKLLKKIRSKKYRYVVVEATSHGLDQFRFFPLTPFIAVLTNITHEHLDYHKTFDKYLAAKLRLFRHAKHTVINKDLEIFPRLNESLPKNLFSTYSLKTSSQLKPSNVSYLVSSTRFTLGNLDYEIPLTGAYNLSNTLAAISVALIIGISPSTIRRALKSFPGVKGRLEEIPNSKGLHLYVDFAHTPNALGSVLKNLDHMKRKGKKLIVVLGSAGARDKEKRPMMGKVASSYADQIIITSEDPRSEDPAKIASDIIAGIPSDQRDKVEIIIDRQAAITRAVQLAKRGDWVVSCGKGHEESMNLDGITETPWSESEAFKTALKKYDK